MLNLIYVIEKEKHLFTDLQHNSIAKHKICYSKCPCMLAHSHVHCKNS